jgi:hypothetical protein
VKSTAFKLNVYERQDVTGKLWRKLVDMSILDDYSATTIPIWVCKNWKIESTFKNVTSQSDDRSKVHLTFNKKNYVCKLTCENRAKHNRQPLYRLWISEELRDELKKTFLMSYVRSLEKKLIKRRRNTQLVGNDVLHEIPFNEFVDIEYLGKKRFKLKAHYLQKPLFQNFFQSLIESHTLSKLEHGENVNYVFKSKWIKKGNLKKIAPSPKNVIYHLIDTNKKQYYIGKADNLVRRLKDKRPEIPKWNYFRYTVLPEYYSAQDLLMFERICIRDFFSILESTKKRSREYHFPISDYKLKNKIVDL